MRARFNKVFVVVFLFQIGCDFNDGRMQVINNSQHTIAVEFSTDTTFISKNKVEYYLSNSIAPEMTRQYLKRDKKGWSNFVKSSVDGKLSLYIYNIDTLRKYMDIDYIKENKIYNLREYTLEELEKDNWIIKYP